MSSAEPGGESHRPQRTELVWEGKRTQVERIALPFQIIETINVSRATREETPLLAGLTTNPDANGDGWRNKLIWGDNKYVLASLLEEFAGKVDLIYIDPPFDTGDDFSFRVRVGDVGVGKEPSIIEERAYRDTWGRGVDSYLQMMYDRLVLMRELLSETGCIYVHMGPNLNHLVRAVMDEVFGGDSHLNEIIWRRAFAHSDSRRCGIIHDAILLYAKSASWIWNEVRQRPDPDYIETFFDQVDEVTGKRYQRVTLTAPGITKAGPSGKPWRGIDPTAIGRHWAKSHEELDRLDREGRIHWPKDGVPRLKRFEDEYEGLVVQDIWTDISKIHNQSPELTGFPTQKPEALLERIIKASSTEGDLVADFFCGSGTTLAVAEKLGRRWIGCDLGRFAVHVARKRLLDIPNCRPFEVLNLGKYERQHWQVHVNGHGANPEVVVARYLDFIIHLYRAERVQGFTHLHGRKAGRMVHVGATDAPVTLAEITDALDECAANSFRGLDVLGWEWEMGLHDLVPVEARKRGVDLRLLTIPREVMDKRAVEAGDVHFYELAYLDAEVRKSGTEVQVGLRNFIVPNLELIPQDVRDKVKRWSDYMDFWAVDWDYQGDTFHNAWQSYRTRRHPTLRLESDPHPYEAPGRYQVMVKVIDIFGNDTTKLIPVTVP
jgi:adenine-specific DNA-methyltransferase